VSSPGLDRIVERAQDFPRFVGQRMRVTLRMPVEGRTRAPAGVLTAADAGGLSVQVDSAAPPRRDRQRREGAAGAGRVVPWDLRLNWQAERLR
jgi:hypothetical protein